jgi:glycosyltransferase involved in cell wall biosynthesis
MRELPLVSVVTPSYNSGPFLEETIRSVLAQDYPRIEYNVVDGGSSDGTLEILERYRERLRFESRPDRGAADAVNRGFDLSRGSILAWLSADDTYLPGAVSAAVAALAQHPDAGAVYGDGLWVDAGGKVIGRYPTRPFDPGLLGKECYVCQPAVFLRREAYQRAGGLDPGLESCYDWDLWIRVARLYPLVKIDRCLATSRMHSASKTLGKRRTVYREGCRILRKHYQYVPFQWTYDYARFLVEKRDGFLAPFRPSVPAYLLSLLLGIRFNPRHLPRFLWDWISAANLRRPSA